ncbi:MAG: TRAP transporter substrate-binding protein [Fimbriimonadaceae bacterium]|nr:TRAP transporter substrate-binding protein [Alphaproteobacteria bacterium]
MRKIMKLFNWMIALSISGVVGFTALPAKAEDLPSTEFTFVGTWANLSLYKKLERPFWEEEIPSLSGGAVQVKVQPFTEMGLGGGEVFRLLRSGVIDMGSTVLSYIGGEIPEAEAVDMAGITRSIDEAHAISNAYKPVLAQAFEETYGVKLLAIVPYHAQVIFCRDPIESVADLKGRKIRSYGKSMGDLVAALGGIPVGMAFGEVVPALQKGVVDCAITGALSGNLARWHQATSYLYPLPISWAITFVAANKTFWDSLDPRVQSFLTEQIGKWEERAWESGRSETDDGISCNTGGECKDGNVAGMTLNPVVEQDFKTIREIMENTVLPQWAKECGADCTKRWNETVGQVIGVTAQVSE